MATRSNALSEIARFWLQECYGFFLRESVPVKLKHNNSDIDFIVTSPAGRPCKPLLGFIQFENAIVETKDERDFDKYGTDIAKRLCEDYEQLNGNRMITSEAQCRFSMLKEQHHKEAENIFGQSADFSKIFIFHNLNRNGLKDKLDELRDRNIHFVTSSEMLLDIYKFLKESRNGAGVRNSLVGDILDMLITYHEWEPCKTKFRE